jgi:hypothetical protein
VTSCEILASKYHAHCSGKIVVISFLISVTSAGATLPAAGEDVVETRRVFPLV